jgi:hypothetical protein
MTDDVIPQDVQQFVLQNIDSIAQLEGLLLLRSDPAKAWSAADLAQRLYIGEPETAQLLAQLLARELLAVTGSTPLVYSYRPKTADLEQMVDRLAKVYAKYLVPVTHLVHSKPRSRIQEFSDAFWIRKD